MHITQMKYCTCEYERHGPVLRAETGPAFWHTASLLCEPPRRVDQSDVPCRAGVKPRLLLEVIVQAGLANYVYTGNYKHK